MYRKIQRWCRTGMIKERKPLWLRTYQWKNSRIFRSLSGGADETGEEYEQLDKMSSCSSRRWSLEASCGEFVISRRTWRADEVKRLGFDLIKENLLAQERWSGSEIRDLLKPDLANWQQMQISSCKSPREEFWLQSGASSQAKIGGAYFSGVTGSIHNPIAVPGPCEVTEP